MSVNGVPGSNQISHVAHCGGDRWGHDQCQISFFLPILSLINVLIVKDRRILKIKGIRMRYSKPCGVEVGVGHGLNLQLSEEKKHSSYSIQTSYDVRENFFGRHVGDLGSRSRCHRSDWDFSLSPLEVWATHAITTKFGSHTPMLLTWDTFE